MANLLLSRAQIFWVIIFLFLYTFILLGNYCIFIFICLIAPQRPALLSSLSGNLISPCVQDTGTSTPAVGGRTKLTEHNFLHIFWANHNELYCSHKRPIPIMSTSTHCVRPTLNNCYLLSFYLFYQSTGDSTVLEKRHKCYLGATNFCWFLPQELVLSLWILPILELVLDVRVWAE